MASHITRALFMHQASPHQQLAGIVRSVLDENMTPGQLKRPGETCLFAEIGDYLIHVARIFSKVADKLANGSHMSVYADQLIHEGEQSTGLSELGPIFDFDEARKALRFDSNLITSSKGEECQGKLTTIQGHYCTSQVGGREDREHMAAKEKPFIFPGMSKRVRGGT